MSESADPKKWTPPPFGSPCWIEIPAVDVQTCKKFYEGLFPTWDWRPATEAYPEAKIAMWGFAGPSGLSGGITQTPAESKSAELKMGMGVTVYHLVESIEETQMRAVELGATVLAEKTKEGDHGFHVILKDVEGNRFGIYEFKMS